MRCCDVEALWDELREREECANDPAFAHLRNCPECRAIFDANNEVCATLEQLAHIVCPDDFAARVMSRVKERCIPERRVDSLTRVLSPIGTLFVAFGDQRISYLGIDCGNSTADLAARIENRIGREVVTSEPPEWLVSAIDRFFSTWRAETAILDTSSLTQFELAALRQAAAIPPGQVRSYGWIAREIGRPQAARAVGQAMARNPLALLFPCHRVVDASGALNNYAYGLTYKSKLLSLEGYVQEAAGSICETVRPESKVAR